MRKILLTIFAFALIITGCSTQASKPKDIRDEIYDGIVETLTMYEDYIEEGIIPSSEQKRKEEFFFTNVSNQNDLTDTEKEAVRAIGGVQFSVIFYDRGRREGNNNSQRDALKDYMESKNEVKQILNLK